MSCLLQSGTGDLVLTPVNGAKRLTIVQDPTQCAAQKLTNRFLLFAGEWFLDTTVGLLYYSLIAVKNPNLSMLQRYFTKVILSVPPIVAVNNLSLTLNARRQAQLSFTATTNTNQTIVGGPGNSFTVQP